MPILDKGDYSSLSKFTLVYLKKEMKGRDNTKHVKDSQHISRWVKWLVNEEWGLGIEP